MKNKNKKVIAILAIATSVITFLANQSPSENWESECEEPKDELTMEEITRSAGKSYQTMLWKGRGGWGGIATTKEGNIIASRSPAGSTIKVSEDGGLNWSKSKKIDKMRRTSALSGGNLISGKCDNVYYLSPKNSRIYKSINGGASWLNRRTRINYLPEKKLNVELVAAMQKGITLKWGERKGRLITAARLWGVRNNNRPSNRDKHTAVALYSDDNGLSWNFSDELSQKGLGESALYELRNGEIKYNSREHMTEGGRFSASSTDGGETWSKPIRTEELPMGQEA